MQGEDEFEEWTVGSYTPLHETEEMNPLALRRLSLKMTYRIEEAGNDIYVRQIQIGANKFGTMRYEPFGNQRRVIIKSGDKVFAEIPPPVTYQGELGFNYVANMFLFYTRVDNSKYQLMRYDCAGKAYLDPIELESNMNPNLIGHSREFVYFHYIPKVQRVNLLTGEIETLSIEIGYSRFKAILNNEHIYYNNPNRGVCKWSVNTMTEKTCQNLAKHFTGGLTNLHFYKGFIFGLGIDNVSYKQNYRNKSKIIAFSPNFDAILDSMNFYVRSENCYNERYCFEIKEGARIQVLGELVKRSSHSMFTFIRLWTVMRKKIKFVEVAIDEFRKVHLSEMQNWSQIGAREFQVTLSKKVQKYRWKNIKLNVEY